MLNLSKNVLIIVYFLLFLNPGSGIYLCGGALWLVLLILFTTDEAYSSQHPNAGAGITSACSTSESVIPYQMKKAASV